MSARAVGMAGFLVGVILVFILMARLGLNWRHPVILGVWILEALLAFWFTWETEG